MKSQNERISITEDLEKIREVITQSNLESLMKEVVAVKRRYSTVDNKELLAKLNKLRTDILALFEGADADALTAMPTNEYIDWIQFFAEAKRLLTLKNAKLETDIQEQDRI